MKQQPNRGRRITGHPSQQELEAEILALLHDAGLPPDYADKDRDRAAPSHEPDTRSNAAYTTIVGTPRAWRPRPLGMGHWLRPLTGIVCAAAAMGLSIALLWAVVDPPEEPVPPDREVASAPPPMVAPLDSTDRSGMLDAPDAVAVLDDLAQATLQAPWLRVSDGTTRVRLIHWSSLQSASQPSPELITRYLSSDGTTTTTTSASGASWDDRGRVSLPPDSTWNTPGPATRTKRPSALPGSLQELPADPDSLTSTLLSDPAKCTSTAHCLVTAIITARIDGAIPPRSMSAVWQALTMSADVRTLGPTRDRIGRPSTGLFIPGDIGDDDYILYADPVTGALLGHEVVRPDGAVMSFSIIVDATHVETSSVPD
ncbi:hypothetical protein [Nocardioides sp. AE5]|uniref:hypothetical protein n=1 Tax=Nocardioides sp. AE5 TaxID=2962573 RepID=UPI0028822875|nr:hypothetical protein [Nocardioides sp. AE5]MDT0200938.1 hypothetical protein [Nocardioides sp. AE5]